MQQRVQYVEKATVAHVQLTPQNFFVVVVQQRPQVFQAKCKLFELKPMFRPGIRVRGL